MGSIPKGEGNLGWQGKLGQQSDKSDLAVVLRLPDKSDLVVGNKLRAVKAWLTLTKGPRSELS